MNEDIVARLKAVTAWIESTDVRIDYVTVGAFVRAGAAPGDPLATYSNMHAGTDGSLVWNAPLHENSGPWHFVEGITYLNRHDRE